jgi:DNA-directed RNA polymerase beta' subunit/intein/homing endonuclease
MKLKIQSDVTRNCDELSFDGDEMNLHMPQDLESEAELRGLAALPYQLISPGNNGAIIGVFQDSLLGSYLFSRENIRFSPREAMNLLMMLDTVNEKELNRVISENKTVSSFDLLSQIMPPLSMKYKTKAYNADKTDKENHNAVIEIINGSFKRGQLDKSVLGGNTRGLVQRICNDFGNFAATDFLDNLQNMVTMYMKSSAFSVGVSDLISDKKTNDEIVEVISKRKNDVKNIIDQTEIGVFENNTGRTNQEEFEMQVNNILNQATSESGKIGLRSLSKGNRFVTMVNAGSKGSDLNISFMISCLGQQNVDGKRIPYSLQDRTLPHFTRFDDSPAARGFVESSYVNGLSPQELFMHAQGGREGLIDTAVKSVSWDTRVIIVENNKPIYTEIGQWIDGKLDNAATRSKVKVYGPEERNMELLDIDAGQIFIPTTNEKGVVSWQEVTAMTRHDPGNTLYEIETKSGRQVTVTESKSLLVWDFVRQGFFEMLTPDIKTGDCLPVTAELEDFSALLYSINLDTYLPKDEYIYGSDYNKAMILMQKAMEGRERIPSGWWNENNGVQFILPYTKKSSLQRALVRCKNNDNIENGYIYHYHASRTTSIRFPDKFDLNEENGIFVGLFLAEGNVNAGQVCITNNNINIQQFVKQWFTMHQIAFREVSEINKIGGQTSSIIGSCKVLADFLTKFLGRGAANKYVPSEAFIANKTFVKGLLNGYFSGDGTISRNSVESGSASFRLTEGISFLCSRFGIFAKLFKTQTKTNNLGTKNILPSYRLAIRAQWSKKFAQEITLIDDIKQTKLQRISFTSLHRNYLPCNNVVLDPIVSIKPISPENNPKMYDLTIPTTLNFGLANGLQVRDTSTTGYIQRRLIKGLEDLKVCYDGTVRNGMDNIIQFVYGDDGTDTVKVENQPLPLVTQSIQEIYAHFNVIEESDRSKSLSKVFLPKAYTRYKNQKQKMMELNQKYTDYMIQMRDEIVKNIFRNKGDSTVNTPVGFQYIVSNVQGQLNIASSSLVDITLVEVYELLEAAFENLQKLHYAPPTELFKVLFFYSLAPKELVLVKRFNRNAIMLLLESIHIAYKRAIVAPGEMVGLLAGQTLGEISTQLTLNSFHFAGVSSKSNTTRGVPRIEEILSVSTEPKNPSLTVYLKAEDETSKDRAQSVMYMLEHTCLGEIVESIGVYFDPDDLNSLIEDDRDTIEQYRYFENMVSECAGNKEDDPEDAMNKKSKWILRMEMDPEVMLEKNITMEDVSFTLRNAYGNDINCIYTDYNADKLVFRVRMNEVMKNGIKISKKKGSPLDQSDQIYVLKNFQEQLMENIVLRGIKGIGKVTMRKIKDNVVENNGVYVKQDIWVLDTVGTNLLDVMGLDYIDPYRTFSNDIMEVYHTLGIEAARMAIYNELTDVVEYDGTYINYHNYRVLVDRMTYSYKIISIFRHGINNDNIGPIAKASFEETPEMFLKAARHADLDPMRGVSANIMCGQEGLFGTGAFQVVLDLEEMQKLNESSDFKEPVTDDNDLFVLRSEALLEPNTEEGNCSIHNLAVQNNVVSIKETDLGDDNDEYNPGF